MFVDLYDLSVDETGLSFWQETARWIKYEEDAEGVDNRWGLPHVAYITHHSVLLLRKCLAEGVVLLDVESNGFGDVCSKITKAMAENYNMDPERTAAVLETLNHYHQHVQERGPRTLVRVPNLSFMSRTDSVAPKPSAPIPDIITPPIAMSGGLDRSQSRKESPGIQAPGNEISPSMLKSDRKESVISYMSEGVVDGDVGLSMPEFHGPAPRKQILLSPFSISGLDRLTSIGSGNDGYSQEIRELMKKVPPECESTQVFAGEMAELLTARFAMVRVQNAHYMPELLGAPIPIRFLFVILGPTIADFSYHEIGRSIATLMSTSKFRDIAYAAKDSAEIVAGIDEFLDDSLVIPPGDIDSLQLLNADEIKKALKRRHARKVVALRGLSEMPDDEDSTVDTSPNMRKLGKAPVVVRKKRRGDPLKRTGRLLGGLINDLKWRFTYYKSDFTDGFNLQCLTTTIFMFFAAFAPSISFGGLMGKYTEHAMGEMETLLAQGICGIIWGLFAAQPMMIMSPTGPVLIFEASMYKFCHDLGLDFLIVRVWAGLWLVLIAFITVLFEGSFLVGYVTPFTEDVFALIISIIFIGESVKFVVKTFDQHPVVTLKEYTLYAEHVNASSLLEDTCHDSLLPNVSSLNGNCTLLEHSYETLAYQPNTALLTTIIVLATFALAFLLKKLRTSVYLGRTLRRGLGDFGVLIAILVITGLRHGLFPNTYIPQLHMPSTFQFSNMTKRHNSIFIPFRLPPDQWWGYLFAAAPAILVYILLFVETEITELILGKKERGLRKGSGYHWDLMLVAILSLICSVLGLPWMCAAAVQSLAHCNALTVMKRHAPGERPGVDHVIEQRITTISVSILVGACAFLGQILSHLSLAVLFGVFLYLGVMNLLPIQLAHRLVLLFIPRKYFPDEVFCRQVEMWRMHLFTGSQIFCLIVIYLVKHYQQSALVFPFVLMLTAALRRWVVPKIFTEQELSALDGHEQHGEEEEEFPHFVF